MRNATDTFLKYLIELVLYLRINFMVKTRGWSPDRSILTSRFLHNSGFLSAITVINLNIFATLIGYMRTDEDRFAHTRILNIHNSKCLGVQQSTLTYLLLCRVVGAKRPSCCGTNAWFIFTAGRIRRSVLRRNSSVLQLKQRTRI